MRLEIEVFRWTLLFKGTVSIISNDDDARFTTITLKVMSAELGTLEWWISGLMLNPLFFLISRLNNACSSLVINLQID